MILHSNLLICYVPIFGTMFVDEMLATSNCDTPCIFPFEYDFTNYTKCIDFDPYHDEPWCVTNQTLFDEAQEWNQPDGKAIGWSTCSSSCEVEIIECDTSKCQFPFKYKKYTYNSCTTLDFSHDGWCVTNQTIFDDNNVDLLLYFKDNSSEIKGIKYSEYGFDICSRTCSFEHRICKECEAHYFYKNKEYSGCTTFDSYLFNEDRNSLVPWCITNQTSYDMEDKGWEYCSWECGAQSTTEYNCIIMIIIAGSILVSGAILRFSIQVIKKYRSKKMLRFYWTP